MLTDPVIHSKNKASLEPCSAEDPRARFEDVSWLPSGFISMAGKSPNRMEVSIFLWSIFQLAMFDDILLVKLPFSYGFPMVVLW